MTWTGSGLAGPMFRNISPSWSYSFHVLLSCSFPQSERSSVWDCLWHLKVWLLLLVLVLLPQKDAYVIAQQGCVEWRMNGKQKKSNFSFTSAGNSLLLALYPIKKKTERESKWRCFTMRWHSMPCIPILLIIIAIVICIFLSWGEGVVFSQAFSV